MSHLSGNFKVISNQSRPSLFCLCISGTILRANGRCAIFNFKKKKGYVLFSQPLSEQQKQYQYFLRKKMSSQSVKLHLLGVSKAVSSILWPSSVDGVPCHRGGLVFNHVTWACNCDHMITGGRVYHDVHKELFNQNLLGKN